MPYFAFVAGLSIAVTLITLHLLVSDINKTNPAAPIPHRGRYSFSEVNEIKRLHQQLFPGSSRYRFFRTFEIFDWGLAAVLIVIFIVFLIYSNH